MSSPICVIRPVVSASAGDVDMLQGHAVEWCHSLAPVAPTPTRAVPDDDATDPCDDGQDMLFDMEEDIETDDNGTGRAIRTGSGLVDKPPAMFAQPPRPAPLEPRNDAPPPDAKPVAQTPPHPYAAAIAAAAPLAHVLASIRALTAPTSAFQCQLQRDVLVVVAVMSVRAHHAGDTPPPPCGLTAQLSSCLSAACYSLSWRRALGGSSDMRAFSHLRNDFLTVRDGLTGSDVIVDASFRSSFVTPHATRRYSDILACVPEVLVAPRSAVVSLVQLLCAEMACSFLQQGRPLPPWRRAHAMLSKWVPMHAADMVYIPGTGSPVTPEMSPVAAPLAGLSPDGHPPHGGHSSGGIAIPGASPTQSPHPVALGFNSPKV